MKRLLLGLLPAVLIAGQARYARLGEFEGKVEIQLRSGEAWSAAERNLPLVESAWLRTGAGSRLEIELDDGSAWRLGPDSQVEISDYTRLSTGQRLTVLSLDHGVAYFTGEPGSRDTLTLAVPGAQVTLSRGARVRLEADGTVSRIAVIEGTVRLFCPAAEMDIREGQTVRIEPANAARFGLVREVAALELDRWSEERDKALATSTSGAHVAQRFGLVDMDAAGEWVQTDAGAVWKPRVAEGWAPFQNGRWRWYDAVGYTWVSDEAWGWVPYHYGRWTRKGDLGWVWAPSASPVFKPGDVYWLWNAKLAGWGPLAPGENWVTSEAPEQFLNVNTTYAKFQWDQRVIDPAGFEDRPKEPLGVAVFAAALPSPPFPASRLEALRPELRVGATRVHPVIPGTVFQETNDVPPPPPAPTLPPAVVTNPASDGPPVVQPGPMDQGPPGPPMQVIYPVPVYTGIVVINPPEHPDYSRRNPNSQGRKSGNSGNQTTTPVTPAPTRTPGTSGPSTGTNPGPITPPIAPGQPGAPTKPAPVPTVPTTTPTAPSAPPRLTLPGPRPPATPGERPATMPVPVGRDMPRVSKPPDAKPDSKPDAKPARGDTRPETKPDVSAPKADSAPTVKKQ